MPLPSVCAIMLVDGRPEMVRRAVAAFEAQTYTGPRWLLVYDTGAEHSPSSEMLAAPNIWYTIAAGGRPIGELRNAAAFSTVMDPLVEVCYGRPDVFIHWDSDDWSHPSRIAEQVALLQTSGADCVGYSDLLFYEQRPGQFCGAWLYTSSSAKIAPETTLCYWRRTWERRQFDHVQTGEGLRWFTMPPKVGLVAESSIRMQLRQVSEREVYGEGSDIPIDVVQACEPRMIASIHGGNTCSRILPNNREWRRVPEWDTYCRERMSM